MEEHLFSILDAALTCPVKWGYFSDGEAMPRVTMMRMSGRRFHTYNTAGLMQSVVQIDCWDETFSEALTVSRQVRASLEGYSGGPVISAKLVAVRDTIGGGKDAVSRVSLTFSLTHSD
ncbi:DUF3168 domain-containing protein [Thiosulfatihalobacter marinus]|uniref:DUF3168 domain-containing protein n=1 Tax=Thiosulfatihalobacter marinus TaxID=2792481 RepID=UPI0018D7E82D|nr:DUF3168 domain-containing protein [Thiosulfatihalobacter marinus]